MAKNGEISYKQELLRKTIHLTSLHIPLLYYFLSKELMLSIYIPLTICFILIDLASKKFAKVRYLVLKYFGAMLRPHEYSRNILLNGASWVLIAATSCIIIFPKIITITILSILIVSDICAALIGRKFGRHALFDKSVEGTTAFIISAFGVIFAIGLLTGAPFLFYLFGCIAAFVGGIVEAASHKLKVDDNFSIPYSIGILLWFGGIASFYLGQPYLNLL